MSDSRVPLYLITGFLDSGKTTLLTDTLAMDYFNDGQRTVLLRCEDGEEEYDQAELSKRNCRVVPVEDQSQICTAFLEEVDRRYQPERVLLEYNGMWPIQLLRDLKLPRTWGLYQAIDVIDGTTFEMYRTNMQSMIVDMVTEADMVLFNRCTPELAEALRRRNLRMVNRRAEIYLENEDGDSEDYLTGDECPFDLSQAEVDVPDEDFGVWYVDVMDHPDRWAGKLVHMKLLMCHSKKYPGIHCPGRFAMVCCENDIQFLGLIAKGVGLNQYENRDWIEVTARMAVEKHKAYQGRGPVMHVLSVGPCEKPAQDVVTF